MHTHQFLGTPGEVEGFPGVEEAAEHYCEFEVDGSGMKFWEKDLVV